MSILACDWMTQWFKTLLMGPTYHSIIQHVETLTKISSEVFCDSFFFFFFFFFVLFCFVFKILKNGDTPLFLKILNFFFFFFFFVFLSVFAIQTLL